MFRVRAYGEQAGDEPVQDGAVSRRQAGAQLRRQGRRRAARKSTKAGSRPRAASTRIRSCFSTTITSPSGPAPNDRNLIVDNLEVMGPYPPTFKQIIPREHTPEDKMLLAREIVNAFMTRAFRRPSTAGEVDRVLKLVELADREGENFDAGDRPGAAGDAGLAAFPVPRRARSRAEQSAGGAHAQRLRAGHAAVVFPLEQHARRRAVRAGPAGHAAQGRQSRAAGAADAGRSQSRRPWSRTSPASGCNCAT